MADHDGVCLSCGYNSGGAARCPECGVEATDEREAIDHAARADRRARMVGQLVLLLVLVGLIAFCLVSALVLGD